MLLFQNILFILHRENTDGAKTAVATVEIKDYFLRFGTWRHLFSLRSICVE